jgi:DNA repair exonuclease SbcCD ATPase subunit
MKIKSLKLNNFAQFTDFECEFDGKVTRLVGVNGSGKTTIGLTSVWAGLKGIAETNKDGQLIGERFRFIGPKKATADIELVLFDEQKNFEVSVKNHISKQSNSITFEAPKGCGLGDDWLKSLLSAAFLSAKNFTQLSPKEQALLLGIDVSKFDAEIKDLKGEYTLINRDIKAFGEIPQVAKAEKVSVAELIKQKDTIAAHNQEQHTRQANINFANQTIGQLEAKEKELRAQLTSIQAQIISNKAVLETIPKPEVSQDATEIVAAIANAEQTNAQADLYTRTEQKRSQKAAKEKELADNKAQQEEAAQKRLDYIKGFDFGFEGLGVDDDGGLLLNGRPIKEPYFSKGELEIIVAKLYVSKNPALKVRFIDDFEALDKENQESLVSELLEAGFQVITAEVGEDTSKENTILLRECKKATDGPKQPSLL